MHLRHFATEQDVAEEFFALLSKARELYLQDVIADGKRYSRYVDDFVNSHRYIDCDHAVCRNCHEMNIHIVRGLLTDCTTLVKPLFTADSFSFEELINDPPLSFGCNFSREQMASIVCHVVVLFDELLENSFIQSRWHID